MENLHLIPTVTLFLLCASTCSATVYTVGGSSGWDISTDIDSWEKDKTFNVGDTLLFQYSQYHSVDEVSRENYDGCNTTNVVQGSSNGNTTFVLNEPGDRYFVCGNRLHCLGGMKIHVNVIGSRILSPVEAPQTQPNLNLNLPPGSSRSSNPSNSGSCLCRVGMGSLFLWLLSVLVINLAKL